MKIAIKLLRAVICIVFSAVILINVWTIVQQKALGRENPGVFGYTQYIVTSGSMEPELSVGDLIFVKAEDKYELGDVVTFTDAAGSAVTHRLTGSVNGQFITRGDANNADDLDLLQPERIIGKVQTVLPGAGEVMLFFRQPLGIIILLGVTVLLIKLPDWLGEVRPGGGGRHQRYEDG